jgi:hypothetical protein
MTNRRCAFHYNKGHSFPSWVNILNIYLFTTYKQNMHYILERKIGWFFFILAFSITEFLKWKQICKFFFFQTLEGMYLANSFLYLTCLSSSRCYILSLKNSGMESKPVHNCVNEYSFSYHRQRTWPSLSNWQHHYRTLHIIIKYASY